MQSFPPGCIIGWHAVKLPSVVRKPLEELGNVARNRIHFLLKHIINRYSNLRNKSAVLCEDIEPVRKNRHPGQKWRIRTHHRNRQHIGGIHNQLRCVPVVAMIIHRPVEDDEIGSLARFAKAADRSDDGFRSLFVDIDLAIVDI